MAVDTPFNEILTRLLPILSKGHLSLSMLASKCLELTLRFDHFPNRIRM